MIVFCEFTFSLHQEVVPCLNRMRAISWRAERLEIGSVIVDLLPATQAGYVAFPPAVDQSEISTYVVCFRPSREKLGMRYFWQSTSGNWLPSRPLNGVNREN
jgi:hypothetical protein